MAYIGNQPFTTAFLTDQFSGNGSTTAFTLSAAPANTNSLLVAITGVLQDPSTYSVAGTTLTFSAAPPSGTGNISVRFLGIPASGVVTTAYRTLTEFTATAGQTTFTPPSYTVGYINVFRNGVMLGTADYTASNGTTVVLASAASAGDLVVTESFYVSSVLNALPTSGGTLSGALIVPNFTYTGTLTGSTSVLNIGSGQIYKDASGNVGIGTSSPQAKLNSVSTGAALGGTAQFAVGSSSNDYENTYFRIDNSGNSNFCIDQKLSGVFYNRVLIERTTGNFKFDSGYGSVATAYGCRAWVNFNGTGTVAIRASGNVSSITDNGVGDYTVNFTNAMPDANYGINISNGYGTGSEAVFGTVNSTSIPATSGFRLKTRDNSANLMDCAYVFSSVSR